MDTEKQKHFIIHVLYYTIISILCFIFLRTIIYMILPFILGFAIAFALHPLVNVLSKHGHMRLCSTLVLLMFYALIGVLLAWLLCRGFFYVKEWMTTLPSFYQTYIEPYLSTSASSIESVMKNVDVQSAEFFASALTSLQDFLSSLIAKLSNAVLSLLTHLMTSIPTILLSFFFTILSSFFINADYHRITNNWRNYLPEPIHQLVLESKHFLKTTLQHFFSAYAKLMLLTFLELVIGLSLLKVKHVLWISIGIALFDIIPVLGSGGILLPWAIIVYLNQQSKLAIGLLLLYLIITIIRNIMEPKIVGHQIGLHPLLMLVSMYIGAKLFGFLGIFTLPLTILLFKNHYVQKNKNVVLND